MKAWHGTGREGTSLHAKHRNGTRYGVDPRGVLVPVAWALCLAAAEHDEAPRFSGRAAPPSRLGVAAPDVPPHIQIMTAYGYDAPVQAGWTSFGKSFNLSALVEGHRSHGLPGMWRIDCIGCQHLAKTWPGFASGVICEGVVSGRRVKRMCRKTQGDSTDWDEQTRYLMRMARPHLITGLLTGIFLGEELTGHGPGGRSSVAAMFADFEAWVDLVRGLLDEVTPARKAAGHPAPHLYYTEADVVAMWPHIPRNLTLFSMDDYHPAWMYPSTHACAKDGYPRPVGCSNETSGLWVFPRHNEAVFPKLGATTKLLVVPPVYGSRVPCAGQPSVWCTNQSYDQWIELNRGNFTFVSTGSSY